MKIEFIENGSIEAFKVAFDKIESEAKSILILACDGNNYTKEDLDPILSSTSKTVLGGIYPQIIYKDKNYEQGTIITSLDDEIDVTIIENLSNDPNIDKILDEYNPEEYKTLFVFVDGLSKNINKLISALFDNFGLDLNYIGGGSGSLSFIQKPVNFTNQGLKKDCAVIGFSKLTSSIGVKHGWEIISEELQVTDSKDNEIFEINYKDAFEVYKEIVESVSGSKFESNNFFDIAKGYPLGIAKISGELVVRDPITTDGKSLICVGAVPQNSFIHILQGKADKLIEAASLASTNAHYEGKHFSLFIDCISRVLFLEEDFPKEIASIQHDGILIGALTLGEIANNKDHYLEFYNKTSVIANIERR